MPDPYARPSLVLVLLTVALITPLAGQQYQLNQPGSTLLLNGVQGSGTTLATVNTATGQVVGVTLASSNVGLGWEIVLGLLTPIPLSQGALSTAGGQVLNIDVSDPALAFLNGGLVPLFVPFPGNLTFPVVINAPVNVAAQQVNIDPISADGIALSQPVYLQVTTSTPIPGPSGDDTTVAVTLGGSLGGPASVPFYGTSYTQFHVSSNGRVVFVGSDADYSATLGESLTDNPFVGFWTDLNPSLGGTIQIQALTSTVVEVQYLAVPYYFEATAPLTFSIQFNGSTGEVALDGLLGIPPNPLTTAANVGDPQFLGITKGNTGATDGGGTTFALGGSGFPAGPNDMTYDFHDPAVPPGGGLCGSLAPGTLNRILFVPSAGNYVWAGL